MTKLVLAIDQGTTSSRAILFDRQGKVKGLAQQEFKQHFPRAGWVEHDPEDIWKSVVATCRSALRKTGARAKDIAGIGITNQRETTVIWERNSGKPIYRAIVWQDRRTAQVCTDLKHQGYEETEAKKTGLLIDPYFSGTKIAWILDAVQGAREKAERGELAFGTIDSFLVWRLTGGKVHATDATNASRTMLYDIHAGRWDEQLLDLLRIPPSILPSVQDSASVFGLTDPGLFGGSIEVLGVAGDQQAAAIGQACFNPGMMKSTYGTGCFALLNTGEAAVPSRNRLLTTIAFRLQGRTTYAIEGSIFIAGAAVQWLRDGLKIIAKAREASTLARQVEHDHGVYLVPAFVGLGAPYWDAEARGAIFGITRGTTRAEVARAALESVCYQTRDLLEAMRRDWPGAQNAKTVLRVDGGMVASDWTMQFLADILNAPVDCPRVLETTSLGAAYLAGLQSGYYPPPDKFAKMWKLDRRFKPQLNEPQREKMYRGWKSAVQRTLSRTAPDPQEP